MTMSSMLDTELNTYAYSAAGVFDAMQKQAKRDSVLIFAISLSLGVAIYAVIALVLGWGLDMSKFVRHSLTQTAMVPATALGFILGGLSLISALRGLQQMTRLLVLALCAVTTLTILGQTLGWHDPARLFFANTEHTEKMALITALAFYLFAWGTDRLLQGNYFIVECIGVFGVSGAIAITLMNLTGAVDLPGLSYTAGISLQTAILAGLLFLALSIAAYEDDRDRWQE